MNIVGPLLLVAGIIGLSVGIFKSLGLLSDIKDTDPAEKRAERIEKGKPKLKEQLKLLGDIDNGTLSK